MINQEDCKISRWFDIDTFNYYKDGDEYHYTDKNGMNVRQIVWYVVDSDEIEGYIEERSKPGSGYHYTGLYYPDGSLKTYIVSFYDADIKKQDYDSRGQLIRLEDYELVYKFTVNDLIRMFLHTLNLDIRDTRICRGVERDTADEYLSCPYYLVKVSKAIDSWQYTGYLIHGHTGKILFQVDRTVNDKRGSILDNYQEYKRK